MKQLPKAKVRYRWAPEGSPQCGTCAMFRPQDQTCELVKGRIQAAATCTRWTPKGKK